MLDVCDRCVDGPDDGEFVELVGVDMVGAMAMAGRGRRSRMSLVSSLIVAIVCSMLLNLLVNSP